MREFLIFIVITFASLGVLYGLAYYVSHALYTDYRTEQPE